MQRLVKVEQNEKAGEGRSAQDLGNGACTERGLQLAAHRRASRRVVERKSAVFDEIDAESDDDGNE